MSMERKQTRNSNESVPTEAVSFLPWPMYQRFGGGEFHSFCLSGNYDLRRILRKHPKTIVRSELGSRRGGSLLLRFSEDIWCLVSERNLTVCTPDAECSELFAKEMKVRFECTEAHPSFRVILNSFDILHTEEVRLPPGGDMLDADLALHYGEGFTSWMQEWLSRFNSARSGLTLFRGEPGTGKTTFIREIIRRTLQTHNCYFVPISVAEQLSKPAMIEFWLNEATRSQGRRLVAIFEDAETLLATREERSQASVSDLLNASDGLLGDCLQLQIIATVNCPLEKLDVAITRPGRLIGYREFRRLNRSEALALAESKGIQIPERDSLSLAEIYNQSATAHDINGNRRPIGFGHQTQ